MGSGFRVREVFPTLQGEGSRSGSPAVFIRLSGCNLWSGLETGRGNGVGECSRWCDTDFVGGEFFSAETLARLARTIARDAWIVHPLFVLTGGEPLLQLTAPQHLEEGLLLLHKLSGSGKVAIETNGTKTIPESWRPLITHTTISPKALQGDCGPVGGMDHLLERKCDDLKIVVRGGAIPTPFNLPRLLELFSYEHLFFQPMDHNGDQGKRAQENAIRLAAQYGGRVSFQAHKFTGLP